jgi:hypothetical protein
MSSSSGFAKVEGGSHLKQKSTLSNCIKFSFSNPSLCGVYFNFSRLPVSFAPLVLRLRRPIRSPLPPEVGGEDVLSTLIDVEFDEVRDTEGEDEEVSASLKSAVSMLLGVVLCNEADRLVRFRSTIGVSLLLLLHLRNPIDSLLLLSSDT